MHSLGEHRTPFTLDTGNDGGISVPFAATEWLKFKSAPRIVAKVATSQAEFDVLAGALSTDVKIGQYQFIQPTVEYSPMYKGSGSLGIGAIKQFVITFDQRHKLVRFEREGR